MSKKKSPEGVNSRLVRDPIKKWAWLFLLPIIAAVVVAIPLIAKKRKNA